MSLKVLISLSNILTGCITILLEGPHLIKNLKLSSVDPASFQNLPQISASQLKPFQR
jgi:hypothetical protein